MVMTIGRTTIGDWKTGTRVNLERAMRADSRFGGHIVQGHVDGVGIVESVEKVGDAVLVDVAIPAELAKTLVLHGSVALDGVSLTVNALKGDKLQVALIDYTLRNTPGEGIPGARRDRCDRQVRSAPCRAVLKR
jgi:riboflavin synthase